MVIVQLTNGKRVGNFSSNHPFKYTDGTVLPAVSEFDCKRLNVGIHDEPVGVHGDVIMHFMLTMDIQDEMERWMIRYRRTEVDIVICPLMMLQALVKEKGPKWVQQSPFRAIRLEDRIQKLASIEKQCMLDGHW